MIKVLDKKIAERIAAGEVIERPVSIIKELVENAVDAGASSITCEIKNGGKSYIRVTDDGVGIPHDEVETAFLRHATSKIKDVKDLESIETLGFRGEALASIAAVSHTEIVTKTREEQIGTKVVINGGTIISNEKTGSPDGTTIVVTDLFFNTPARLKFMKSDSAESSQIIDLMSQVALCYKNIKFRLINNDKVLFSTLGDGNRMNTIIRIYPDIDPKNMVEMKTVDEGLALEGYISSPQFSKNTRGSQIFFVNGRVVNSKVMEKGVNLGYKERLFEGRYPVCYLFLNVDPSKLDVNIHPNKKEVRFDEEARIIEFISSSIVGSLATKSAVPNLSNSKSIKSEEVFKRALSTESSKQVDIKDFLSNKINEGSRTIFASGSKEKVALAEKVLAPQANFDVSDNNDLGSRSVFASGSKEKVAGSKKELAPQTTLHESSKIEYIDIYEPMLKPFDFSELRVTGNVFDTYITAIDDVNFYLIDQHAAQERIFYEKLVNEYDNSEKVRQPLLTPLIINVDVKMSYDLTWIDALKNMGFTIDEFGSNTYRVTEIPMFMDLGEADLFIHDFIDQIASGEKLKNTVVINKLIMMSCKAAIKANDKLSHEEMVQLLKDLAKCINPYSCPHGRPTAIKLTKYELEKMFKRV